MSTSTRRVLVLNVGKPQDGDISRRPEVFSLRQSQADYVVFISSDPAEPQTGSYSLVDRYAELVGLSPDQYENLVLSNPDDLVDCYQRLVRLFQDLRRRFPFAELLADYTGGTKSMSAAVVLAALDSEQSPEIKLRFVHGQRGGQATVIPGTESFVAVSGIYDLRARRLVFRARDALEHFHYAEADRLLGLALQREISSSLRDQLKPMQDLCRAFDAWDRYELDLAATILTPYRAKWYQRLEVLRQLQAVTEAFAVHQNQQSPDQPRLAGLEQLRDPYIAVEDLLLNAERRAAQNRYDDAMARVYRALELLIQLRLWLGHHIDTSDVDLAHLPEAQRERYASRVEPGRPLTLGLLQAWDLLSDFSDEPLADWLRAERGRLLDWARHRNHSLLAHGFRPITEDMWKTYGSLGIDLCRRGLQILQEKQKRRPLKHDQLPRAELLSELTEEDA